MSSRSSQLLCSHKGHTIRGKLLEHEVQQTSNGRLTIKTQQQYRNRQYRCPPQMTGEAIDIVYNKYLGCDSSTTQTERTKRYLRGVACLRDRLENTRRYHHTNTGHAHAITLAKKHIIQCQPTSKPILSAANQIVSRSKFGPIEHITKDYVNPNRRTLRPKNNQHIINNAYYQKLVNHIARYKTWLNKLEEELTPLNARERL
jgi:hypothetical protein